VATVAPFPVRAGIVTTLPPIVLGEGASLVVHVADDGGHAVSGARVALDEVAGTSRPRTPEAHRGTTDERGLVQIGHAAAEAFSLRIDASGYAPLRRPLVRASDSPIVLTLERPHAIAGRIRDDAGKPVVGESVWAQSHADVYESYQAQVQD